MTVHRDQDTRITARNFVRGQGQVWVWPGPAEMQRFSPRSKGAPRVWKVQRT